MNFQVW